MGWYPVGQLGTWGAGKGPVQRRAGPTHPAGTLPAHAYAGHAPRSAQSINPLQSSSMPLLQVSGPTGVHPRATSAAASFAPGEPLASVAGLPSAEPGSASESARPSDPCDASVPMPSSPLASAVASSVDSASAEPPPAPTLLSALGSSAPSSVACAAASSGSGHVAVSAQSAVPQPWTIAAASENMPARHIATRRCACDRVIESFH